MDIEVLVELGGSQRHLRADFEQLMQIIFVIDCSSLLLLFIASVARQLRLSESLHFFRSRTHRSPRAFRHSFD